MAPRDIVLLLLLPGGMILLAVMIHWIRLS